MVTRRAFLAAQTLLTRPRRPNILFILPDQLRAQSVGCYGNEDVRTNHHEAIARQGAETHPVDDADEDEGEPQAEGHLEAQALGFPVGDGVGPRGLKAKGTIDPKHPR